MAQGLNVSAEMHAMRMRAEALDMVRASIRLRRPEISEDDLEFEVRKRYLPRGMAELPRASPG